MQPHGPLMEEHRLIERMIALVKTEIVRIQIADELDPAFIDLVVDFIRVYADHTHHGKEEEILFPGLMAKGMAPAHEAMLHALVAEHRYARQLTASLVTARNDYVGGNREALGRVVSLMMALTDFYPRHIAREDAEFFPAAMDYLDEGEQADMLDLFLEFDRAVIHEKYGSVVDLLDVRHRTHGERRPIRLRFDHPDSWIHAGIAIDG